MMLMMSGLGARAAVTGLDALRREVGCDADGGGNEGTALRRRRDGGRVDVGSDSEFTDRIDCRAELFASEPVWPLYLRLLDREATI